MGRGLVEDFIESSDFMGFLQSSRFVSTAEFKFLKFVYYLIGQTALLFDS